MRSVLGTGNSHLHLYYFSTLNNISTLPLLWRTRVFITVLNMCSWRDARTRVFLEYIRRNKNTQYNVRFSVVLWSYATILYDHAVQRSLLVSDYITHVLCGPVIDWSERIIDRKKNDTQYVRKPVRFVQYMKSVGVRVWAPFIFVFYRCEKVNFDNLSPLHN